MTTDYSTAKDYDAAMDEAHRAAGGSSIDGFVERIAERVGAKASVRAVFGDPIERGDITVIPVARVRWGFGGGAGRGPFAVGPGVDPQGSGPGGPTDEGLSGAGTGGGGGAIADPIGYLEIGPDGASFIPLGVPMPGPGFLLAAGVAGAIVLRAIGRLLRR